MKFGIFCRDRVMAGNQSQTACLKRFRIEKNFGSVLGDRSVGNDGIDPPVFGGSRRTPPHTQSANNALVLMLQKSGKNMEKTTRQA